MNGEVVRTFDVADQDDHVEVRGVPRNVVIEALDLLVRMRELQADQAAAKRTELVRALMASHVSLTPPATLAQAQRLASRRDALLATAVLTHETLSDLRGDNKESSTRTWVARRRAQRALFTLNHEARTLIPAFQLEPDGEPRLELKAMLKVLIDAGIDGWPLWTWLTSPTSLLSGQVPEVVAKENPTRALQAAVRFAASSAAA